MRKELTIIQQNDTHGSLELHNELFWSPNGPGLKKVGGFSRISQYINEVKSKKPKVLFFDGGDLFHGTLPLVTTQGASLLPALQKMNLDGFVPGNWDFAYGKEQLKANVDRIPFQALSANVIDEGTMQPFFNPYMIKELQGVKVGVIGLTYPFVDQTMPDSFSKGLSFSLGVKETEHIVETIKGDVDLIILISHMGLPLDIKLASLVKGINIILSGHSHDRVKRPIFQDETIIVQAGSSSSFLGRLDITLENRKLQEFNYELIPIFEHFETDWEMDEIINSIIEPYQKDKEDIVGSTNSILHRMTLNEAPMDRLITDAYLHAYDCDLAFSHGWRYGSPIAAGPVSVYDLNSIIPTNPELFTVEIEGHRLLKAIEKNLEQVFSADPFEQKGGYILRSSGMFMTYKPYNPKGNRIQSLLIKGKNVDLHKTYKIVGGGKQLFKGLEANKSYKGVHAIDVIEAYLNKKTINFSGEQHIISV
ncbi:bifunctional metallophosphatase/5'-nucleotidase [Bacillus canaveralius]|uniref:Bifunctional metallophosphatase/5'-nucleotidase n=1 Tax=Bacillus canaveralius TaxID=1403243 RepID=A0A2N5GL08_9BACI|nr:bifunctional metallophosphatase/5'-nucleotidase [Bacillus canaveralius]PLR82207.1 bifunctional metallophosphatase/5'-nucleotidase [Bacillus canaveralius]PLR97887.1 bifunctional metallophosphatase/5'-nucleotidase [Bacillus canaveralius]